MIVDNVLILFTSNPNCPHMRTAARLIEAQGREVFLQPLSSLQRERKPDILPAVTASLSSIQPN